MAATFKIIIRELRTDIVNGLPDVVRSIIFTLQATEQNRVVGNSFHIILDAPDPAAFIPFDQLTEADAIAFVEANFAAMNDMKIRMELGLQRQIADSSFQPKPFPWIQNL